jgi:hypothetical protein
MDAITAKRSVMSGQNYQWMKITMVTAIMMLLMIAGFPLAGTTTMMMRATFTERPLMIYSVESRHLKIITIKHCGMLIALAYLDFKSYKILQ